MLKTTERCPCKGRGSATGMGAVGAIPLPCDGGMAYNYRCTQMCSMRTRKPARGNNARLARHAAVKSVRARSIKRKPAARYARYYQISMSAGCGACAECHEYNGPFGGSHAARRAGCGEGVRGGVPPCALTRGVSVCTAGGPALWAMDPSSPTKYGGSACV